jgi:hypothetical protein
LIYRARFKARFLPTRSRRKGDSVLLTSGGGSDREKADDKKVAWAVFNGGGDSIRRCSGSKDFSGGSGVGEGSSKRWIGMRSSGAEARRWRHGLAMAARVWAKFARNTTLFIGVLVANH